MSETLTPAQRHTLPGRTAFAAKFNTPEEKRAYFRRIGERGNAGRVVLSGEDAAALAEAYRLLDSIANKLPPIDERESDPPPKEAAPAGEAGAEEGR